MVVFIGKFVKLYAPDELVVVVSSVLLSLNVMLTPAVTVPDTTPETVVEVTSPIAEPASPPPHPVNVAEISKTIDKA
jgi:hypothetical protein